MAAGDVLLDASGNVILDASGNVILDDGSGNACCCGPTFVCFTKFTSAWDCGAVAWAAWTNAGNFCKDVATTNTSVTHPFPCTAQQFVRVSPDESCTVNGDCTTAATTPAAPTGTPTGCCPSECGCTHAVSAQMRVVIVGTAGVGCFAAADNTGSASLSGGIDNTYDIDVIGGACAWVKTFAGPTMHRDCFSHTCTHGTGDCLGGGDPLDSPECQVEIRVHRTAANTFRLTATSVGGATLYFDATFTWGDQDSCDGVIAGGIANTLVGNDLPTGCNPGWISVGGTASVVAL